MNAKVLIHSCFHFGFVDFCSSHWALVSRLLDLLQGCCRDCVEGCGLLSCCELMGCLACSCGCSEVLGLCWVRDKENILRIYNFYQFVYVYSMFFRQLDYDC